MAKDSQSELEFLQHHGEQALATLFSSREESLTKMVRFRMDQRLWGRVDPADVLQEAYLRISKRFNEFLDDPRVPVFIWFRTMTKQVLIDVHRRNLGAKGRNASLEVSLHRSPGPMATSFSLAARLIADMTTPSQAAIRDEMLDELREAFDQMDPVDREVLALRHFEDLSNNDVAQILGLQKAAASNRYVRALKRLRLVLSQMPSFSDTLKTVTH